MILLMVLIAVLEQVPESSYIYQQQPLMVEIDPQQYILGPGDVLWFSVRGGMPVEYGGADESYLTLEITPDGYAILPSTGAWKVSGMTLSEGRSLIERAFAARYPGLSADVGLAHMRTFQVLITGYVNSPGVIKVTGADGLISVLNKAGGIASAGSWTSVALIETDGDTSRIDLTDFIVHGDSRSNPSLATGERVHVPRAENFVGLEGALNMSPALSVRFPEIAGTAMWNSSVRGTIEFIPDETVSQLVLRVGGTAAWASPDSCYVRRVSGDSTTRIPAPLNDPLLDPKLMPGDVVVCPGDPPMVTVSGEVAQPGVFSHTAGMDGHFYVSEAGGFLRSGSRSGTRIRLPGGEEVDLDEVASVPAGSAIRVPRKALVGWQDPLLILTSLASVVIAWKSVF
ncbi:MAG: hypothetical protein GF388_03425 [Candidatus Aegiribacteria sp.]|nr:hypothetical protein [Candidatus Aegiribacteria sp.]MBD3294315.1 hypothetical protein [Candidatus Fermentibacteria bacterium]